MGERHEAYKDTTLRIREKGWLVGIQVNDIPKSFIEMVISSCFSCHLKHPSHERTIRSFRWYTSKYTMPLAEEKMLLNNIRAQHMVRLQPNGNDNQVRPYPIKVKKYVCHQGRKFQGKSHIDDGLSDKRKTIFYY